MNNGYETPKSGFQQLSPDRVLDLVEAEMGIRCNNLFRPMNSYINRVFEVESVDKTRYIVKFYRPGRWSEEAILDEHRFLYDLAEHELPVIAPIRLQGSQSVGRTEGLFFAVFPKCGGRSVDEFSEEQWLQLGRLLGRMHQIGATKKASNRINMGPQQSTADQLAFLLRGKCVPDQLKPVIEKTVTSIIDDISPLFQDIENIRIHGDCHFSNVIYRPGESLYLIDFDDMVMGPPVQDIWMLLPGGLDDAFVELDFFLEGYETFRPFDRRTLRLVEPLRAMRFVHYMAWCAYQVEEDGITRAIDGFGSWDYWQKEIDDLLDQRERIGENSSVGGNL